MSSFTRTLQRRFSRSKARATDTTPEDAAERPVAAAQGFKMLPDGGYITVRATKGPVRVSARRLQAQARVAQIMYPGEQRQQELDLNRFMRKHEAADAQEKRITDALAQPVAAITRQMRRHAQRTGRALPPVIGETPKPARKSRAKKPAATAAAA